MKLTTAFAAIACILVLTSCGKKPDAAPAPPAPPALSDANQGQFLCSYAPSQSTLVAHLTGAAGGTAAVTAALAQALGLTVVTHSSGAFILTGGSGYIASTIGAAAAGPIVVGAGVVAAGSAGVVELICAPRNHPEMAAKVEAAAVEFASRTRATASTAAASIGSFVAERRVSIIKSGDEAIAYANRKSVAVSEALAR